ncbi:MAG: PAS domain S-box protein [Actinomycetota bacterium]|nr:PAS domain S-box protein [Actinomycetota bacterium]
MQRAADILRIAVTAGFVFLAASSTIQWARTRERVTGFLAGALGLLALVVLIGDIDRLTDERYEFLGVISFLNFLGSGYLLLLFRHEFVPLRAWIRGGVLAGLLLTGALMTVFPAPGDPARYETQDFVVVYSALLLWAFCVGEPALRFWLASRDRPVVQRARLRSLSFAHVTLILLVFLAVIGGRAEGDQAEVDLLVNLGALMLVPVLYASLAPPRWLRGIWRAKEEGTFRLAEDLATYAPDTPTVADRAVRQVMELVGADGAFIRAADGRVVAARGLSEDEAGRAGDGVNTRDVERVVETVGGRPRHVVLLPTRADDDPDVLGVVLGPFTPLFGSDEIARLRDYAALVDVTLDRVRLSEEVAAERERFEALLRAVSDVGEGFVVLDEGRVEYANEAYCEMTGYSLEELKALPTLLELSRPEDRDVLTDRFRGRLAGDDVGDHYESALVRKDGTIKWIEVAVKLLDTPNGRRVVSLVRDVSERKEADRSLARHTSTLQLLQRIAVSANEAEDLEEVLRVAVQEVCWYTGWPVGHVLLAADELADELVPLDIWCSGDPSYERFKQATQSVGIPKGGPFPAAVLDSAAPVWVEDLTEEGGSGRADVALECGLRAAFAFPILSGKEVAGVLEFFNDEVTEPDPALLDVMTNIGTQLGRVAERKRIDNFRNAFISNAAHELRTPVTPIVGYSSLLADRWEQMSDDDRTTITHSLRQQGNRLRTLVNSLLDFTRVQRGRMQIDLEPVRLQGVFQNVLEAVPPPDGKSVRVGKADGAVVLADPARLEDMLVNLVVNAYRYGGDQIELDAYAGGEGVLISVSDNGAGVQPDLVAGLFDPFTRGERSSDAGGSGLGLAIVRMLAKAQGGDVWYEDAEGRPTFVLKLRPAPEGAAASN